MELIDRENRMYGPPARLKMHEPESDIKAVWGPSLWAQSHTCTVRGVPVCKMGPSRVEGKDVHRRVVLCVFPDHRTMWVNERNIKVRKIIGEIHGQGALERAS